jgi:hypothetical protein
LALEEAGRTAVRALFLVKVVGVMHEKKVQNIPLVAFGIAILWVGWGNALDLLLPGVDTHVALRTWKGSIWIRRYSWSTRTNSVPS